MPLSPADPLPRRRIRVLDPELAYVDTLVRPMTWQDWPEPARRIFQAMRSPAGEEIVLVKNVFVERLLPASVMRGLGPEELERYRAPYREPGDSRRPTLAWPREIPLDCEPADVVAVARAYADWLTRSPVPKLFVNGDPGFLLTGALRDFCRTFPNQQEVTVRGTHLVHEDSPDAICPAFRDYGRKGWPVAANPAIDIALWGLKGKALRQPVSRLLGGPSGRRSAPTPPVCTAIASPTTPPRWPARPKRTRPRAFTR